MILDKFEFIAYKDAANIARNIPFVIGFFIFYIFLLIDVL